MNDRTVLAAVAAAVLAALWLVDDPTAAKKGDERFEAIEADQKALQKKLRKVESQVFALEAMRDALDASVGRVLPTESKWISLSSGTTETWSFDDGGVAKIQVLDMDMDGVPRFDISNKGGKVEAALSPGHAVLLIDDLGSSRRLYETAIHRVRRDRSGHPVQALVSVDLTIETL